jgi:small-conductance mechanosensitive channel
MALIDVLVKAEELFSSMSFYLNKIIIALVILLFGFIIGKIIENLLRVVLARINTDERLFQLFKVRRNYARAIRRTIVRIIYIATVVIALQQVSLVRPVLLLLLFLTVVVILISFALAGLDVVPNIAARASLRTKKISIGDEVIVSDRSGVLQGTIVDMTLTDVHIRRRNGDLFFVPNSVFLRENITKKRRS